MTAKICPSCGNQNDPDSMFCVVCGEVLSSAQSVVSQTPAYSESFQRPVSSTGTEFLLASWPVRFVAWVIDWVILIIGIAILSTILRSIIFARLSLGFFWSPFGGGWLYLILIFAYWILMEYQYGATIGKMVLNLKIVNVQTGEKPNNIIPLLISNIGKNTPLLIIDFLFALFIEECVQLNQRIFQRAADLVVIVENQNRHMRHR
ncbi:MAG: RDD family protein [Candidatus Hodarchaeota archaeon]